MHHDVVVELNRDGLVNIVSKMHRTGWTCRTNDASSNSDSLNWILLQIWNQSGSDRPQMGQFRDFFRSDSVHFGSVLNLI